jgi:hypothetical protein
MFLTEMGNRYEIKHYIDIILNYLIRDIEEINISFYSLDMENRKDKNVYINGDNNNNNNLNKIKDKKKDNNTRNTYINNFNLDTSTFSGVNIDNILKRKNLLDEDINMIHIKNETKSNMKQILNKELYEILFLDINEKYIRDKFEKETDDIMKHFYVRLLRQINSASNPDLYNTNKYFDKQNQLQYPPIDFFLLSEFPHNILLSFHYPT